MDTPIGPLLIASTSKGLCRIDFNKGNKAVYNLHRWAKKWLNHEQVKEDQDGLKDVCVQLDEYFNGKRQTFDITMDLYGTPFQKMVWTALSNIPYGQTRSYKEVAKEIGTPKAVRAIGGANNKNPLPIIVPCHRVIGTNGALVGYGGGLNIKEYLLKLEQ